LIAKVFRDGEPGKAHSRTRARRLVHLAVNQCAFGAGGGAVVLLGILVDARLDHPSIEVIAFARTLADAREHGIAAMRLGDIVDQLLDNDGLADAGAAEQPDLAAAGIGRKQVNDLDAGNEDLSLR
jgi:hypothetical protein